MQWNTPSVHPLGPLANVSAVPGIHADLRGLANLETRMLE